MPATKQPLLLKKLPKAILPPAKPLFPSPARRSHRRFSVRKPGPQQRWVVFEQGRLAHHLRDDDLFAAERTLCGKPAFDADLRRLPLFNCFPADYQLCRVCCVVLYRERA